MNVNQLLEALESLPEEYRSANVVVLMVGDCKFMAVVRTRKLIFGEIKTVELETESTAYYEP